MTQQDNQNQKRTNEATVSGTIHRIVHGTRAEEQGAACQSPAGLTLSIRSCIFPPSQDHTEVLTPAYNGYGNEDDLYAMGLSLEPLTKEVNQEEYER